MTSQAAEAGEHATVFKTYKRRWGMVLMFMFLALCGSVQWLQYFVMANNIALYYHVDRYAVDWLTYIFTVVYVFFSLPAMWLQNTKGMRLTVTIGAAALCLGAWIKVLSTGYDLFLVTFLGQVLAALGNVCVASNAAPLAAIWFGPKQTALATSIGFTGTLLGFFLNLFVAKLFILDATIDYQVKYELPYIFGITAIITTVALVFILIFFRSQPPSPPSKAQALQSNAPAQNLKEFGKSVWQILSNSNFVLLMVTFGVSQGFLFAIMLNLKKLVTSIYYFTEPKLAVAFMHATFLALGIVMTLVLGGILHFVKHKKRFNVIWMSVASLISIFYALQYVNIPYLIVLHLALALMGLFLFGQIPVAYELLAELTYPQSLSTASAMLMMFTQICALAFTLICDVIIDSGGHLAANLTATGLIAVATAISAFIKPHYNRSKAARALQASQANEEIPTVQ